MPNSHYFSSFLHCFSAVHTGYTWGCPHCCPLYLKGVRPVGQLMMDEATTKEVPAGELQRGLFLVGKLGHLGQNHESNAGPCGARQQRLLSCDLFMTQVGEESDSFSPPSAPNDPGAHHHIIILPSSLLYPNILLSATSLIFYKYVYQSHEITCCQQRFAHALMELNCKNT